MKTDKGDETALQRKLTEEKCTSKYHCINYEKFLAWKKAPSRCPLKKFTTEVCSEGK